MYTKSFFRSMNLLKKQIVSERNKEEGDIWLEVKDLMVSGSYSTYKQCKEFVTMVMSGYNDSYIARNFNIEEPTVRIHKRKISNELYSLFGKDFFDLFDNFSANKETIKARLINAKSCNITSNDLVPDIITALVATSINAEEPLSSIDLGFCHKEISFLVRHSLKKIREEFKDLDVLKLEYLLRVLNRQTGSAKDRQEIITLLYKGDTTND